MWELSPDATRVLPIEELRRYTMCPLLEARSGGGRLIFARRSDAGKITFAWFDLVVDDATVAKCGLRTDVSDSVYLRFIEKSAGELPAISPEAAKTRLFHAVRCGEEAGRFPPKEFAWVAALLDGIELQNA